MQAPGLNDLREQHCQQSRRDVRAPRRHCVLTGNARGRCEPPDRAIDRRNISAAGVVEVFDGDRAPQAELAILEHRCRASRQLHARRTAGNIEKITNVFVLRPGGECAIGFELPQPPVDCAIDDVVFASRRKDLVRGAQVEEGDHSGRAVFAVVFDRAVAIARKPKTTRRGFQLDRYLVGNRCRALHPSLDRLAGYPLDLHDASSLRVRQTSAEDEVAKRCADGFDRKHDPQPLPRPVDIPLSHEGLACASVVAQEFT